MPVYFPPTKGSKGDPGTPGINATMSAGTTTTGLPGTNASVTNSGTSTNAVWNFTIPRGAQGSQGLAGQDSTVPGPAGPKGDVGPASTVPGPQGNPGTAATISIGTVSTGAAGTSASVSNAGTISAAVLNFTIPRGDIGATGTAGTNGSNGSNGSAATVTVGTVSTGAPGSSATVTNTGTSNAAVLNFSIPAGQTGATGSTGSTGATGPAGSPPVKTFNSPLKIIAINSIQQISATQDAQVTYSVDIQTSVSLSGSATGTVFLEYADNAGFTTNVKEVGRFVNGQSGTLVVGLTLTQTSTANLSGIIPAGKYARVRTDNTVGTPVFTWRSGQEVLY
jgi:hypothetical protein